MSFLKPDMKYLINKCSSILVMMAMLLSIFMMSNPAPAGATNTVGDKTTEITIIVNDNGSITTAGVFTISDLQNLSQTKAIYSAINNNTNCKFYAAEGVLLTDLLDYTNIDLDTIDKFTFTATDNYERTFTRNYLFDTERYCYPTLDDNYSTEEAVQVQPILALKSAEFAQYDQVDFNQADDYYAVRLFFGQNEQDLVNDQGYVKWLNQIQVYTKPVDAGPPVLTADFVHNLVGQSVQLEFADDQEWRNAITDIAVDGSSIAGQYSVDAGTIIIDGAVFNNAKDYAVVVKASGYQDACVTQHKGDWPVIFTLDGDAVQLNYTMADLRAMTATTDQYGPLTCKGVALKDLLKEANITDTSWQAQINVKDADTFPIEPVGIADLLDPNNRYLLTYEINGQPISFDANNQTNLRIYWGMGITYKHVDGITINKVLASDTEVGLVITGEGIKNGAGFTGNVVYLTQQEVKNAVDNKELAGTMLEDCWTTAPVMFSAYEDHGTPVTHYRYVEGIDLQKVLLKLGLSTADINNLSSKVESNKNSVGRRYAVVVPNFAADSRVYFPSDGSASTSVPPVLSFYETAQAGIEDWTTPVKLNDANFIPYPTLIYGQKDETEHNNCNCVKGVQKLTIGAPDTALGISIDGKKKSAIDLGEIVLMGRYHTEYSYIKDGVTITHQVDGVPLSKLLEENGISVTNADAELTFSVLDSGTKPTPWTGRIVKGLEIDRCFVAYAAEDAAGAITDNTPLRVYCPGEFGNQVLIRNVAALNIVNPAGGDGGDSDVSGIYTITPVTDTAYQSDSTQEGIKTMTVNTGNSGMVYFAVQVAPVTEHSGEEAVVFVHLRGGEQLSLNVTKADFDVVSNAKCGFNVQAGDIVKAFIVDDLTNDVNFNPTILQPKSTLK